MFKKLPNSTRKFVRSEKARIRRQFFDFKKQEEAITNMYNKLSNRPTTEGPEIIKTEKAPVKKQEKPNQKSKIQKSKKEKQKEGNKKPASRQAGKKKKK